MSSSDLNCGNGGGADSYTNLRIASVFIVLIGSSFGALFPVLAKKTQWVKVPDAVFESVLQSSSLPLCSPSFTASPSILVPVSSSVSFFGLVPPFLTLETDSHFLYPLTEPSS
jgi:hypothetical protein